MTSTRTAQQLVKHKGQFRQGPPTDAVVAQLAADFLRLREAICEFDEALTLTVTLTGEDGMEADQRYRLAERVLCEIAREAR